MARLWLLDFDGTLVDSEKAIKACYLKVGQELVPNRCDFIENMIIGPTLDESSRMILTDKNLHLLDSFKKRFQQLYDEKLVLETTEYPGVYETLKELNRQGDHLGIVTNKRAYPTRKLINYYNWENLFSWVACMDEHPIAQNKSDLISIKNINHNSYKGIYLIGDTISDGEAAKDHKISFVKANYGYGKIQNWKNIPIYNSINNFSEILKII